MTDENATDPTQIDDNDVDVILNSETEDGKGGAVVPKADFESYEAGENVTAYQDESNA